MQFTHLRILLNCVDLILILKLFRKVLYGMYFYYSTCILFYFHYVTICVNRQSLIENVTFEVVNFVTWSVLMP